MTLQLSTAAMLAVSGYTNKPQMHSRLSHIRFMQLKDIVIANLSALMASRNDCSSQNSLAKKSGVSQSHVGRILRGESTPTVEMIEALARALRVTPAQLLTENLGRTEPNADQPPLSDEASNLLAVIQLLDAGGGQRAALQAAELLLRQALPTTTEAARGHPDMAAMLEKFTKDPGSLTAESFTLLRRQMQRAAGNPTKNNNDQTRKKAGGSGA